MKKCIIIGAGNFIEKKIIKNNDDLLIVADAGYKNFLKVKNLNIDDIDVVIGDFDSMQLEKMNINNKTNIYKLNPIKDDSDTFDACLYGIKEGYTNFVFYGVLGKRIEHSIGNIQILVYLKEKGLNGIIKEGKKILRVIENEKIEFNRKYKGYISCYSLSSTCMNVTIKGLKYEVENIEMSYNMPTLGLDNEFINKDGYIEVGCGKLLLIYKDYYEDCFSI